MNSYDYIIPILNVFLSFLVFLYSVILSIKRQRYTFYLSMVLSVLFLLSSSIQLGFFLINDVTFNITVFYAPLSAIILFYGAVLYLYDGDLKKKFGNAELKDMQRIERTEKEYLSKMSKLLQKRGREIKFDNSKKNKEITDPSFLKLEKPLFIAGMKDTGKSTIGRILCAKLGTSFVDTDALLLKSIQPRYQSIRQFYTIRGPEAYMQQEAMCIYNYFKTDKTPAIVALGGGVCNNNYAIKMSRELGTIVYIEVSAETLFRRITKEGVLPAFVDKKHPFESFKEVYEKRSRIYRSFADLVIELNENDSPLVNANKVLRLLEEYYASPESKKPRVKTPTNIIRLPRQPENNDQK